MRLQCHLGGRGEGSDVWMCVCGRTGLDWPVLYVQSVTVLDRTALDLLELAVLARAGRRPGLCRDAG